jgi:tRNA (cytidine32/uridine32-2'-O)-methyltransferase
MLASIRIVLVNTSHPGNIGAAARAMKTMGLATLYLVAPKQLPDATAYARAAGAEDVLSQAIVVPTLDTALEGCHWVAGTSARPRSLTWPELGPRALGPAAIKAAAQGTIALLFGNEQSGLSNEELARCHFHVRIPSNPSYSSLNVAAAVQILCYEIQMAYLEQTAVSQVVENSAEVPATHDELTQFYEQLEQVLVQIGFLNPAYPKHLMRRLRRLYARAQLSHTEVNILRGILTETTRTVSQGAMTA